MTEYVRGPATWRTLPRVDTKPSSINRHGSRDSGGGYERVRSYEHDPTRPGDSKSDVYASHHRLLAVVACYPDEMPVGEILAHMAGRDVHHESGVEWDNRPDNLTVTEHGSHSQITQAEMRAWAADSKREVQRQRRIADALKRCARCDEEADVLADVDGYDGNVCLSCSKIVADDGQTIHL